MSDRVDRPPVRSDLDKREMVTPAEARALGIVQEVNRLYLHPLGYALGVQFKSEVPEPGDEGTFFLAQTGDPEGFIFGPKFEPHEIDRGHVLAEEYRRGTVLREESLGYPNGIQPLHGFQNGPNGEDYGVLYGRAAYTPDEPEASHD